MAVGKGAKWTLFLALCSFLAAVSFTNPEHLSDDGNSFLRDFLDNDLLSVLGFITAVGNASVLSIFLHLNHLEDEASFKTTRTRESLRKSAVSLVYVFLFSFVVVVLKPRLSHTEELNALFNSLGIVAVYFCLSVLRDLTLVVFAIPTKKKIAEMQERNRRAAKER